MLTRAIVAVIVLAGPLVGAVAADEPFFPFVISYDTPENVTNLSGWLDRPGGCVSFPWTSPAIAAQRSPATDRTAGP